MYITEAHHTVTCGHIEQREGDHQNSVFISKWSNLRVIHWSYIVLEYDLNNKTHTEAFNPQLSYKDVLNTVRQYHMEIFK